MLRSRHRDSWARTSSSRSKNRSARTRIQPRERKMASSIAVHSFKGGTGKTTITANLAVALVSHGKSVGVMDMDLEGPGLHVLFNVNPDQIMHTLNDVLLDKAHAEEAALPMNDRLGLKGGGMLYFSPASTKIDDMLRTLGTGIMVKVASTLGKSNHLIVNMIPAGLKNSQASKLANGIGDQFNVDVVGWFPFSEEVQRSLSRSVFILTERRHSMTAKFQELARQVERFS